MSKKGFVYMITYKLKTVIYTGVTNNIYERMHDYKNYNGGYFASKYRCKYLIYYEGHSDISEAIKREKQLKNWHKEWKWNLVKSANPESKDLSEHWFDEKGNLIDPALAIEHLRNF